MQARNANIAVIYDNITTCKIVVAALAEYFTVRPVPLDEYGANGSLVAALTVFCVDLGAKATFDRLKKSLTSGEHELLFVLPTFNSETIAKLRGYSDADYLISPIVPHELRSLVKKTLNRPVERIWETLHPQKRQALKETVVVFEACFDQAQEGNPLPIEDIQDCCQLIRQAAELGGLDSWIDALDDHHDYSFRHSMFVCGTLAYFAQAIGIRGADLDQLTIGGLLHDIGKARIPLAILDKPGKLDDSEWQIMKQHPVSSQDILRRENDLDPDMVAMAVSHHEKLDGTGYPHGLSGAKINDHVRLTAIADVYSALIDKRAYKGSMTSEAALEIMAQSKDHLDLDLFGSFQSFVLDKG
jgi:putative nucleotidyltransferase with HDIG domain